MDTLCFCNGIFAHFQEVIGIDAFNLLVRQVSDGGMEPVRPSLYAHRFRRGGGQGYEQDVAFDAVAAIQRIICLVTVFPQIISGFSVLERSMSAATSSSTSMM